jgi:uncharacterized protein (TIGR03435 family)
MICRVLGLLLTIAVAALFGQPGIFGPISVRLKAGDDAPEIEFTKILSAPTQATWNPAILSGQLTVLAFFPDTTHNLESVARWNKLIGQFSGKPVQFVWVTQEGESSLAPWLAEHPLQGWLLLDSSGATGRSYGMELPSGVFIGADRKIIGFDQSIVPSADTISAALEGRVITNRPKLGRAELMAFIQSRQVLLNAEPPRMPRPDDHKPDFPPSYTFHVSPSQTEDRGNFSGMDFRSLKGLDLKEVIGELYNLNPIRIDLPTAFDDGKRYDFSVVLPEPEDRKKMDERFRQGIQDHFHLVATRESRISDVYIVTAPGRKPPSVEARTDEESMAFSSSSSVGFAVRTTGSSVEFADLPKALPIGAIRSIWVEGTADEFCRVLEEKLDRPVMNETNLEGEFSFRVEAGRSAKNDFLDRLRDESGLVITPAKRTVEMLVFTPR